MSATSTIEWTDASWNPTRGCRKISPGCKHCYAETFAERFEGVPGHAYELGFKPRLAPDKLDAPLHWKKPRRIFVNSMSDLFLEDFSDEYIAACFGVMAACPQHTFQILTKRAERMAAWFDSMGEGARFLRRCGDAAEAARAPVYVVGKGGRSPWNGLRFEWPQPHIWMGVSVEDQSRADERIPHLLRVPAAVRFLSYEPALGPVHFDDGIPGIDWIIIGGESGHGARPFDIAWARSVIYQARASAAAVFVKQLGANVITRNDDGLSGDGPDDWPLRDPVGQVEHDLDGTRDGYQGAPVRVHLKSHKGGDPSEWPADLRVREFPEPRHV